MKKKKSFTVVLFGLLIGLVLICVIIKLCLDHWIHHYADSVHHITQISGANANTVDMLGLLLSAKKIVFRTVDKEGMSALWEKATSSTTAEGFIVKYVAELAPQRVPELVEILRKELNSDDKNRQLKAAMALSSLQDKNIDTHLRKAAEEILATIERERKEEKK